MLKVLNYVNNGKMQEISNCACVCMYWAWGDAWCVPSVYLGDAWQGMVRHKLGKVCKTHTQWSKYVKQVQSRVNSNNGTQLSPKHHKNVTWAFCQTHGMQHYNIPMGNAWTHGNMPKYRFKMPQGANTNTHKTNGTQPNQNFEKDLPKNKVPNPFFKKSPILEP